MTAPKDPAITALREAATISSVGHWVGVPDTRIFERLSLYAPADGRYVPDIGLVLRIDGDRVELGPPQTFAPYWLARLLLISLPLCIAVLALFGGVSWFVHRSAEARYDTAALLLIAAMAAPVVLGMVGLCLPVLLPYMRARKKGPCMMLDGASGIIALPRQGLTIPLSRLRALHVNTGMLRHGGPSPGSQPVMQIAAEFESERAVRFACLWLGSRAGLKRWPQRFKSAFQAPVHTGDLGTTDIQGRSNC